MKEITEAMLDDLRLQIMEGMSPKRFLHTAAVERMIERLCALYCPELTLRMRAAALLHDLTKERKPEEQLALCEQYGLPVTPEDRLSPKTLHARTAAARIEHEMPAFSDALIVNAVRWHTTGHANMTLTEKLLYLADYIDDSRTFENCVILRRYFFGADPDRMNEAERAELLRKTLLLSFDMTVKDLMAENKLIARDTVEARNSLLLEKAAE